MLIGYVRVSKSDGSQTLAPQRDALLAAGVADERIYQALPGDYPMVAPAYARARSSLAKEVGLGNLRRRVKA